MKNDTLTTPLNIQITGTPTTLPEYASHHTATALFGLGRSSLYNLANDGHIKSVCILREGNKRGKRLFDCASIRAFLNSVSLNA